MRLVVASHRRLLDEASSEGRFGKTFCFRLNVVELTVPPLRERAGDIALLAHFFAQRIAARDGVRDAPLHAHSDGCNGQLRLAGQHPGAAQREVERAIKWFTRVSRSTAATLANASGGSASGSSGLLARTRRIYARVSFKSMARKRRSCCKPSPTPAGTCRRPRAFSASRGSW